MPCAVHHKPVNTLSVPRCLIASWCWSPPVLWPTPATDDACSKQRWSNTVSHAILPSLPQPLTTLRVLFPLQRKRDGARISPPPPEPPLLRPPGPRQHPFPPLLPQNSLERRPRYCTCKQSPHKRTHAPMHNHNHATHHSRNRENNSSSLTEAESGSRGTWVAYPGTPTRSSEIEPPQVPE